MYIKIAAGLIKSYPLKNYEQNKCTLSCKTSPCMQNYKHDLGNKYKNSFKAAALSTMYKICLTNLNSNLILLLWYWKVNITLISLYHVTVKSCDQFRHKLYWIQCVVYYLYTLNLQSVKLKTDTFILLKDVLT